MGYNHQRIKENARTFFRNNSGRAIIVVLIVFIIGGVLGGLYAGSVDDEGHASAFGSLIRLCGTIFGTNVLAMGLAGWYRRSIYEIREPGTLFDVFKENYMGKVGTALLRDLFISLWSLLFLIPGIIKAYEYYMVDFIKEENPNIPAQRCLEISKILTNGHKADLCYLDFSFFGWHLLSALTLFILEIVYVGPYYYSARAFAYEELKAEAFAAGKLDPAELSGYYQAMGNMGGMNNNMGGMNNNMGGMSNNMGGMSNNMGGMSNNMGSMNNNMGSMNNNMGSMNNNSFNEYKGGDQDSSIYYTPKD